MNSKGALTISGLAWITLCGLLITNRADAEPKHFIEGIVIDDKGNPVRDAFVALGPLLTLFEREQQGRIKINFSEDFRLGLSIPGRATVSVWHPDFIGSVQSATTGEPLSVVLQPGNVLEGKVDCPEDLKADIVVSAYFSDSGYQEYARAARDGTFRFGNLPAGSCELEVRAENGPGTRRVVLRDTVATRSGEAARADLAVSPTTSSLTGTVTDAANEPLTAQVTLFLDTDSGKYVETIRGGTDGHYVFPALPVGKGQLIVGANDKASRIQSVEIQDEGETLEPLQLGEAQSLRCSFLDAPEGTVAARLLLFPGKIKQSGELLSDVRALLDMPTVWSGVVRENSAALNMLAPGPYTLLAFPLASTASSPEYDVFETAENLRLMPGYMDSFTVREDGAGVVVAAAFPRDERAAFAASHLPMHPIVGSWTYTYKGSVWTRTFTPDGRCILAEGTVTDWVHPYVVLGEQRVAVLIKGTRRIHTINADGTLDVEGQFTGTRME